MQATTKTSNFRYIALADEIQAGIRKGAFSPGEKLPSLRQLHIQMGLSISTVHQAYIELEKRGLVEAREKSGFYVRPMQHNPLKPPEPGQINTGPRRVMINEMAQAIINDLQSEKILKLGAAVPSKELMPLKQLSRILKSIPSDDIQQIMGSYDHYQGNLQLRKAVARRMLEIGCAVSFKDIVITSGCLDAVFLCLRAIAVPGDAILVESPAFHCFLQLLEDLNLFVVEIPGCPDKGIHPDTFQKALKDYNIKVCLLNSNFHNPLGSVVSRENKQKILDAAKKQDAIIIEDDIYGDLFYGEQRPSTYKSMDTDGQVLYCSSFSKSLAPGLRLGWTIPGRFKTALVRLKLNSIISGTSITQKLVAEFIRSGAFDRHLRQLRNRLNQQASAMALAVSEYFPKDTRITFPRGGMCIWIELPAGHDSMTVYHKALKKNISILPGAICSTSDRYRNCLRLNCGVKWDKTLENGIRTLGKIVHETGRDLL